MAATEMRGAPVAERIRATVAEEVKRIGHVGLVTILVGDDPASQTYIRLKHKAATEAGIDAVDVRLPADTPEDDLLRRVARYNASDDVDAILVQLPLPAHIDEEKVIRAVAPAKDVDGFHPLNAGELYLGRPAIVSATPRGVMALLAEHRVELDGARAVVVGRSDIVGKPMALLLMHANATVTICHSHTRDLDRHTLDADVLVVAAGIPALVAPDMVKERAVVVDVGMNRTGAGLVGDVDPGAFDVASAMTPVPGGVGPMTIACLLENAVRCSRYRRGELAYPS
ncbi:MAG TPA: bifunctional 5,10-methylenetetrahydrofolate dehydrogenase/5,10-methenyltetrahydrofolate cyclohydrolase [Gaiellaceae bacterium]|nr:bifunctional 5,10-methylenetetrahydrofolate dehydrogenase/5,10-methenyltetrahydrofolate cyclohydrolase [Gaiellaceae bacterium]